ncbi:DNA replication initiation control protein YabA [Fructilactobacillus fructivorans]|uniref:DNA replication initiation control protein YabA n=1 Tax=Fructilactobacillus fructivorans TaxID=1614 RepID=A0A0C1PPA0_9LACO|nr:DNA replication initiation control protein YabA [Fructilactobacillus fructivorans]KID41696.1 DNA replication initiation control protein YabA [Fructilactobacillus fructivorans]KRK57717.1 hypothetical protein FC73_GL000725 [Fructilactobacillus fructivorans]KRN12741.1 hypothetical protein IV37_GL001043 [Fructilactobacillus fructivorans]KRN40595.1 hypothetical protein IV51_GL001216 [Fructilactobacillus fructivorans]KRN43136.1 hypothetical protein IV48_GL000691 [Fructilactobacillus fructivorans]
MKESDVNEEFNNLKSQSELMSERIGDLRDEVDKVIEENSELKIENEHLRELIAGKDGKNKKKQQLSMSKKNLEKLYNEGFHVCTQFYGKRRDSNSSCMFCTDIIYGER